MANLTVYTFDYETGAYTGQQLLGAGDIDPRSPGTLLIPGNATAEPPPRFSSGLWPFWRDGQWVMYEEVAPSEPPSPPPPPLPPPNPFNDDYYLNL